MAVGGAGTLSRVFDAALAAATSKYDCSPPITVEPLGL